MARTSSTLDVLLVDCFTTDRLPPELCSQQFYENCKQALTRNGLLVANLCWQKHTGTVARIRQAFNGKILLSKDKDGNTVVFACKGKLLWPEDESDQSFRSRLSQFERKHKLGKAIGPRG